MKFSVHTSRNRFFKKMNHELISNILEHHDFGFTDGGFYIFAQAIKSILDDNNIESKLISIVDSRNRICNIALKVNSSQEEDENHKAEYLDADGCIGELRFKQNVLEYYSYPGTTYKDLAIVEFSYDDKNENHVKYVIKNENLSMDLKKTILRDHAAELNTVLSGLEQKEKFWKSKNYH